MKKIKPWSAERLKRWQTIRAKGREHYIWFHGVLLWGGFMFCFSLAMFQQRLYGHVLSTEGNLPFRIGLSLMVWIFVGYLYGKSRWQQNEWEYSQQPDNHRKDF